MDARQQLSSPAAMAMSLLLLCSTFLGSQASAYGDGSGAGGMTALQMHAAFFDANNDGVVTFSETYDAFREFGFGIAASSLSATFINGALSPKTRPVLILQKKPSSFVPEKFEAIFAKHAKTVPDALTSAEVDELISANRQPSDYAGWAGAAGEWKILYSIGKDKDGLLRKDAARDVYDGSLFARVVQERRKSAQQNQA